MTCDEFAKICSDFGFTFFSGVPDSTFRSWMTYLENEDHGFQHVRCVNECEAIAVASGYHLATGKIGVVYLQNSGLGKTVNPITSLAHQEVYSIPILLMIGWRGEPGKTDAYQHRKMGPITLDLLDELDIPFEFLTENESENRELIEKATTMMNERKTPFALIVKKGIFEDKHQVPAITDGMTREEALNVIVNSTTIKDIFISTTGKTSRELFEIRDLMGQPHDTDFYNIGAMGCAQSIAFGIAQQKPDSKIIVLDGDAAVLMQLGAMATIGYYSPKNLYHVILDNSAHDSTGGQMTVSNEIDFEKISNGCGYKKYFEASSMDGLKKDLESFLHSEGPVLFRVKVQKGSRGDLKRPPEKPLFYKSLFMKHINGSN